MTGALEYSASATVTMTFKFTGKGHWGANATVQEVSRLGGNETI